MWLLYVVCRFTTLNFDPFSSRGRRTPMRFIGVAVSQSFFVLHGPESGPLVGYSVVKSLELKESVWLTMDIAFSLQPPCLLSSFLIMDLEYGLG